MGEVGILRQVRNGSKVRKGKGRSGSEQVS